MNIFCKLFGHKVSVGWRREVGEGYFKVRSITVDGINRHHVSLWDECERCGKEYKIGNVHIPDRYVDAIMEKQSKIYNTLYNV